MPACYRAMHAVDIAREVGGQLTFELRLSVLKDFSHAASACVQFFHAHAESCASSLIARMLRVNHIPATNGAEQISGLRECRSDLQQLLTARARSLNQTALRGRIRELLLAFADVRVDARKLDAWCIWSTKRGDQPFFTGPSGAVQARKRPVGHQHGVALPSSGRNSLCPTGLTKQSHIDSTPQVFFPLDPTFASEDDDLRWCGSFRSGRPS